VGPTLEVAGVVMLPNQAFFKPEPRLDNVVHRVRWRPPPSGSRSDTPSEPIRSPHAQLLQEREAKEGNIVDRRTLRATGSGIA